MTSHAEHADNHPLISTKLNMPRRTSDLILRPRLIDKLNQGLDHKLTLVSAPAGYGKTTLLLSWLETCARPSVWLSLDEHDNYLPRFFRYIIAAIQSRFPHACKTTLELLQTQLVHQSDYLVAALVNDIAAIDEAFIFALDDYHLIHHPDIHQLMQALIKAQPAQLHLAIAARVDPPLALSRLRANHQLTEVRVRDLRFSAEEAVRFFHETVGEDVDQATAVGLNQLAEGWTVGLRLAALSFHTGRDGTAILAGYRSGASDFVTDYLMGEVLERQPAALQEFLLRTALVDRFCADLCRAICFDILQDGANVTEQLARIKRTSLFLTPLDAEEGWYRYHHLFTEMLRHRLLRLHSQEQVVALHLRAAEWFAAHGYLDEAIQHALAADDVAYAVQLVEGRTQNLLNPIDRLVLERWLSLLPDEVIWRSPKILNTRGWILFRQWNMTALDTVLDRIVALLDEDLCLPDERRLIEGQVATLRSATAYAKHHEYRTAIALSERGFKQTLPSERDARGLALMMQTLSLQALGDRDLAVRRLTLNIEDASPQSPNKAQSYISLALLHYMAGELAEMHQTIRSMDIFADGSKSVNARTGVNYVAGFLWYERNDLPVAETHFANLFEHRHRPNLMGGLAAGLGLIRLWQLKGRLDAAQKLIDRIRSEILEIENFFLLPLVEAAQAQQHLLVGDEATARRWARALDWDVLTNGAFNFELPTLVQARILVHCGTEAKVKALKTQLQAQLAILEANHFIKSAIQTLAHLALVADRLGAPDEALAMAHRAVELGQPAGFIRSLADAGAGLIPYLQQVSEQGADPAYITRLLSAVDHDDTTSSRDDQRAGIDTPPTIDLIEPLTRREDEIMQLIGRGMTNQEIAEKLIISPHTVKTHATNIYAKLGVRGRTRAVHKARKLGILPSQL